MSQGEAEGEGGNKTENVLKKKKKQQGCTIRYCEVSSEGGTGYSPLWK